MTARATRTGTELLIGLGLLIIATDPPGLAQIGGSQSPQQRLVRALDAISNKVYHEAVTDLQKVVAAEPNNEAGWYYLGVAQYRQGGYAEASAALDKAAKLAPQRWGVWLQIGHVRRARGQLEEAIAAYQQELANHPRSQSAPVWVALGGVYAQTGRLQKAEECFAQALYYEPNYVEAYYRWGLALMAGDRPQAAVKQFAQASAVLDRWRRLDRRVERLPAAERRRAGVVEEELAQQYWWAQQFAEQQGLWPELNKATGDALMQLEQWAQARAAYREALAASKLGNPADPDGFVRIGQAYLAEVKQLFGEENLLYNAIGGLSSAKRAVEQAFNVSRQYAPAQALLGEIYAFEANTYASDPERGIVSHSFDQAIAQFEKALRQQPGYVPAMVALARTCLDKARQLPPGDAQARSAIAQAAEMLQQARELSPENKDIWLQQARTRLLEGNYQAAEDMASQVLDAEPRRVAALNVAGLAAYFQGELSTAADYFTRALEIDPHHGPTHTNLANVLFQQKKWYRARDHYRQALKYTPTAQLAKTAAQRAYLYYLLALTFHHTSDYQQEVSALNEALSLDPGYFAAYRQLGEAYLALKQYEAARRALEAASFRTESDEEAADCYSRLAEAYQAEGQPHRAMAAYSRALEFDPDNARAARALAELGG